MPLVNIFTGNDLDDWSGKRTVKTGQQARSVVTTTSSIGTDKALPSSPGTGFLDQTSSKGSVDSSDSGSSAEGTSDDNSTIVVNEGRFIEPLVVSDSDDDGDSVYPDDFSAEGYGGTGCISCDAIVMDDTPESIDSEAIDYWKRVKANRKRNLTRKRSSHSLSNIKGVAVETDFTEIEVVHDEKTGTQPEPSSDSKEDPDTTESQSFLRILKSLSKSQRLSTRNNARNDTSGADRSFPMEAAFDNGVSDEKNKDRLSSLVKKLSKRKLISVDAKETPVTYEHHSCESSTEEGWDPKDKYKTPDESDSSQSREYNKVQEERQGIGGEEKDSEPNQLDAQALENVLIPLDHISETLSPPGNSKNHKKNIWHASIKSGAAATRAMRSRASSLRNSKKKKEEEEEEEEKKKLRSADMSERSEGAASEQIQTATSASAIDEGRDSLLRRTSHSARLSHLGKGIKHSVSRIKKIGKRKSISEPNLVVCIDGKGDRLGPKSNRSPESKETKLSETEASSVADKESESCGSVASGVAGCSDGLLQEKAAMVAKLGTPVVLEMCHMGTDVSLAPNTNVPSFRFEDEENSVCSSAASAGQTDQTENTGWFLSHQETRKRISKEANAPQRTAPKAQPMHPAEDDSDLSRLGVETQFEGSLDRNIHDEDSSVASSSESIVTTSSEGDLNTLSSSSSVDDSILYELFPVNSFSSLTGIKCQEGIKCHEGCTSTGVHPELVNDPTEAIPEEQKEGTAMVRGRSRVRSQGRHSSTTRCMRQAMTGDDRGICNLDGTPEDAIIECIAEDPKKLIIAEGP